ncbi:MAG: hypothetical protein Q8N21_00565 [bacterium]|nr:hypothetical protein [bacterium]
MDHAGLLIKLIKGTCLGYIHSNDIKSESGFGRAAAYMALTAERIKEEQFQVKAEYWKIMRELEETASKLPLQHRIIEDYLGNLVGVSEWYEDPVQKRVIELGKGFFFPGLKKEGLPILGLRQIVTANGYYRGFSYPTIYDLDNGKKLIELYKKFARSRKKFLTGLLSSLVAIPVALLTDNAFVTIGIMVIAGGYAFKHLFGMVFRIGNAIEKIKPLFQGDAALEFFKLHPEYAEIIKKAEVK